MADQTTETAEPEVADKTPADELSALKSEMEQMRRELAAERSQRQQAVDGQANAERRVLSAEEKRLIAEEASCKSGIDALNAEADGIEADIARLADEPGHGAEIAKLNRRLAAVVNKAQTEEGRQTWLAGQREKAKSQAEAPIDQGDKLANGAPLKQFAPSVREFFDAHPKVKTDVPYLNRVIALSLAARDVEGYAENSPEYFEYIDQRLDGRQPTAPARTLAPAAEEGEDLPLTVQEPQSRAAGPGSMRAAVAAVARPTHTAATASGTPGNRRAPLLTADEREVADSLFQHIPQKDRYAHYADRKAMMAQRRPGAFGAN